MTIAPTIVILATGGTIAGAAGSAQDNVGYRAGQIGVATLIDAVPALSDFALEAEQVAQIDSKDMSEALWWQLASRCAAHLARAEVGGMVITHGTDTLEETAWFLHRVLAPSKPVVLVGAMRPATSLLADGPQNLLDAVRLAGAPGVTGVLVAFAGKVFGAAEVQKLHGYRLDAFGDPDGGPTALIEEGRVRLLRRWPLAAQAPLQLPPPPWPWVELVTSRAASEARTIEALCHAGVAGLVIAGTGNGTVHEALLAALAEASERGVALALASRCAGGAVLAARPAHWRVYPGLNAVKSRVELMLELAGGASVAP